MGNIEAFSSESKEQTFEEMDFSYHEIKLDGDIYRCITYEIKNGGIIMRDVFMEGKNEKYSEFIEMNKNDLEYIKKKKAVSKEALVKENKSDCFIDTAQGDMPLQAKIPITVLLVIGMIMGIRQKVIEYGQISRNK